MKGLAVVRISILLALLFAALSVSPTAACEGSADDDVRCGSWHVVRPAPTPPPPPPPIVLAVAALARVSRGTSPFDAMEVQDTWRNLDAGASEWYKIDNGNNFYLSVWLDAKGISGVTLSAFAPEQANGLSASTPPKGRGAPVKYDPSHDQFWLGAQARGVWHILVTNTNTFPVQYKIGDKQSTEERNCISYWETLPTGQYVYWTACR